MFTHQAIIITRHLRTIQEEMIWYNAKSIRNMYFSLLFCNILMEIIDGFRKFSLSIDSLAQEKQVKVHI